MEQVQKQKQQDRQEPEPMEEVKAQEKPDLSITDDLLDEIDSVLEENAAEFVKEYVQKGGE